MTIPESGISRPRGRVNTIEVKLEELEQLFNTIDPSPFHEKDLDGRFRRIHRELGKGIFAARAAPVGRVSAKPPSRHRRAEA